MNPLLKPLSRFKSFGGEVRYYQHLSRETQTPMTFSIYVPPQASEGPVPAVLWLSGLTCTADNFTHKAGAQRYAAELGLALVVPDTSPRGAGIPGEDDAYDLGTGAGFYVDATQAPWSGHYRMYSYVVEELPALVEANFPIQPGCWSILGHSMGGHGALICALKNPGKYRAVSAFAPICAPSEVPWGQKALGAYLGADPAAWRAWDTSLLLPDAVERLPLLVSAGDADEFLPLLKLERLQRVCEAVGHPLELRLLAGYDHSYYTIATFIGEHLSWHARALKG